MTEDFTARKQAASQWFSDLRDRIVAAFEALEDGGAGDLPAGRFEVTPTTRTGAAGEDQGGGIFYDDLNSGDWDADFAFTRDVGAAFLPAFLPVTERRLATAWSEADREVQLVHRGLYAEYNLVYDRGTKFGLETGHDANAVLMSLPPLAKWI